MNLNKIALDETNVPYLNPLIPSVPVHASDPGVCYLSFSLSSLAWFDSFRCGDSGARRWSRAGGEGKVGGSGGGAGVEGTYIIFWEN